MLVECVIIHICLKKYKVEYSAPDATAEGRSLKARQENKDE